MEQEYPQPEETTQKKYIRNFTEEARAKQKEHLSQIRQKAMEKKIKLTSFFNEGKRLLKEKDKKLVIGLCTFISFFILFHFVEADYDT
jgi:hypothetical protein